MKQLVSNVYFARALQWGFFSFPTSASKIKLFRNGILYEPCEREIKKQFLTNVNLKKIREKFCRKTECQLDDTAVAQKQPFVGVLQKRCS